MTRPELFPSAHGPRMVIDGTARRSNSLRTGRFGLRVNEALPISAHEPFPSTCAGPEWMFNKDPLSIGESLDRSNSTPQPGQPHGDGPLGGAFLIPRPLAVVDYFVKQPKSRARVGPTHRRIPKLCQTSSGIVPRTRLPRTRFCRALSLITICEAIPPPGISKVAENSPNPNRLS